MRILVVSDSHGVFENLKRAFERTNPDMVIHLGDGALETEVLARQNPHVEVVQVTGNCDYRTNNPFTRFIEVEGVGMYLCHGHTHGVKSSLLDACDAAQSQGAQVLLFGHTHKPLHDKSGDLTVFNPGSVGYDGCYGVIEVSQGKLRCDLQKLF